MVMESSSLSSLSVFHFPGPYSSQATVEGSLASISLSVTLWFFHDIQGNPGSKFMPAWLSNLSQMSPGLCAHPETFTVWSHASASPRKCSAWLEDSHTSLLLKSAPLVLPFSCLEVDRWHDQEGLCSIHMAFCLHTCTCLKPLPFLQRLLLLWPAKKTLPFLGGLGGFSPGSYLPQSYEHKPSYFLE